MKGTPKQIAWATKIRQEWITKIELGEAKFIEKVQKNPDEEARKDIIAAYNRFKHWEFKSAEDWINDRNAIPGAVLLAAKKAKDDKAYTIGTILCELKII